MGSSATSPPSAEPRLSWDHDSEVVNSYRLFKWDLVSRRSGFSDDVLAGNINKILEKEVEPCIRYLVPMASLLGSFREH